MLTGDFARDAILVRAEQITKHEVHHCNLIFLAVCNVDFAPHTDTGSGGEAVCTLFSSAATEDMPADSGEQGTVPGSSAEEGS